MVTTIAICKMMEAAYSNPFLKKYFRLDMENLFSPEIPVLLVGAPGIGKTAQVKAHFSHAEVMLTSTLVEEDISGLPYREGEYDYRTVPAMFRRLHEADLAGKTTVLFLDELDKARRAVADTLLTLVASRCVGSAKLPERTCIVAAANPPEFGGGDGISEAMQSRFSTIDYEPDIEAWCYWANEKFLNESAKSVIGAVKNGELPIFDLTGTGLDRRISSPRTLTMALHSIEKYGAGKAIFELLIRGLLTPSVASQFLHIVSNEKNDVLSKATAMAKRGYVKSKNFSPVRI